MKHLLAAVVACSLAVSTFAQGNFEGIASTTPPGSSGLFNGTAGWAFQAVNGFEVIQLGVFANVIMENPTGPVSVGLWAENGQLLASALVSGSSLLVQETRYSSITPVALAAGQRYYMGAFMLGGVTMNAYGGMAGGSFASSPNILYLGAAQDTNNVAALTIPQLVAGGESVLFAGPNFRVPEPSSFALTGIGLAALALFRRNRK